MEAIATISLAARDADGRGFSVTVEIGRPYPFGEGDWVCPWSAHPLAKPTAGAHGGDSFQALCMAIFRVQSTLHHFRATGGVLHLDGETFPLEAYACGPATSCAL